MAAGGAAGSRPQQCVKKVAASSHAFFRVSYLSFCLAHIPIDKQKWCVPTVDISYSGWMAVGSTTDLFAFVRETYRLLAYITPSVSTVKVASESYHGTMHHHLPPLAVNDTRIKKTIQPGMQRPKEMYRLNALQLNLQRVCCYMWLSFEKFRLLAGVSHS